MSALTIIQADVSHALLLTSLSLQSFREAFEKDNNPDKTYGITWDDKLNVFQINDSI